MAEFNFVELARELDEVQETGVSFEKKSQKWETDKEVKPLIDEIDNCNKLVYLNLEGNTLGIEAAESIGKALAKHPEFKKALWKDLFTGRLKTEIPQALKSLGGGVILAGAQLSVLDCSDNALGPNGMAGLVDFLRSPACFSLQELRLNNCGLGIQGGKMLANALMECYKKSTAAGIPLSLKVFIAGRNRLENEGAKALAAVFEKIKSLEEVSMPQNGIYYAGITALAESFKHNQNMRILNLNDNTIVHIGAAALADAIFHMQKLREIDFGDCLLKTKGAVVIASALNEAHEELEVVNFEANEIGLEGGVEIVTSLLNKSKIRSINLDGNQFGSAGRERIKEVMLESQNSDALGSLSEDASADEEAEDDENTEIGEEEECDEDDYEDYSEDDVYEGESFTTAISEKTFNTTAESNNSVIYVDEETPAKDIKTFCDTPVPSIRMFNSLSEIDKVKGFRDHLNNYKDEDYLISLVFTVLKCSALSKDSSDALLVAEALYKDAFEFAEKTRQITRVKNFFLIQLGLLKTEDKGFTPKYNITACRYALRQTLSKNYFPKEIRESFDLFLDRFD